LAGDWPGRGWLFNRPDWTAQLGMIFLSPCLELFVFLGQRGRPQRPMTVSGQNFLCLAKQFFMGPVGPVFQRKQTVSFSKNRSPFRWLPIYAMSFHVLFFLVDG